VTPGGGVDAGETHAQAAVRELFEETGLTIEDPGVPVWSYDFDVEWDDADHDTGHAEYYVVHTTRFEPSDEGWTDSERVDTLDSRWWNLEDLRTTREPFEPAPLPGLVEKYRHTKENQQ
jgi:8-oxo-dGTP pyrophosphatase MutT (NUDIX family)